MPYIKQEQRALLDARVSEVIGIIRANFNEDKLSGVLNYVITRIVVESFRPVAGWRYDILSNIIKTFECAKLEVYRRLVSRYEKLAIKVNGDLDCLENP